MIATATRMTAEPYSTQFGYGLIDPEKALTAEVPAVQENPLGSLAEWVKLYRKSAEVPQVGEISAPVEPGDLTSAKGFDTTQIVPIGVYVVLGILVLSSLFRRLRRRK